MSETLQPISDDVAARRTLERAMRAYAYSLLCVLHEVTHDEHVYVREMSKLMLDVPGFAQNFGTFSRVVENFEKPLRAELVEIDKTLARQSDAHGGIWGNNILGLMKGHSAEEVLAAAAGYKKARDELTSHTHVHNINLVASTLGMPVSYDEFSNLRGRPDFRREAMKRLAEVSTQQAVV